MEQESAEAPSTTEPELLTSDDLKQLERQNTIAVLEHCGWKISGTNGAAEFLGMNPATLTSRIKAMKIEKPR